MIIFFPKLFLVENTLFSLFICFSVNQLVLNDVLYASQLAELPFFFLFQKTAKIDMSLSVLKNKLRAFMSSPV